MVCENSVPFFLFKTDKQMTHEEFLKAVQNERSFINRLLKSKAIALQNIEKELVFRGFQDETPNVSMCAGCEIILEYHGSEIDIKKAIELMEEIGYISKDNFEI